MSNINFLARAFELADSGKFSRITRIRVALAREGFTLRQLSQLGGKELSKELRARIAATRPVAIEDVGKIEPRSRGRGSKAL
jgi:hypothetical protein